MKAGKIIAIFIFITLISACAKDAIDPDGNLQGTWNVTKVEGQEYTNGNPGIQLSDNNPAGTIRFRANGKGEQDYSFTVLGSITNADGIFSYSATEDEIRIDLLNEPDMIWYRDINTETKQVATFDINFTGNTIIKYTLTLEK